MLITPQRHPEKQVCGETYTDRRPGDVCRVSLHLRADSRILPNVRRERVGCR